MEPKQMLEAVIEKAKEGGWVCPENSTFSLAEHAYDEGEGIRLVPEFCAPVLLFNHKFALAYWGQEVVCADCGELVQSKGWEAWCSGFCADKFRPKASTLQWVYHLKEAVLSEDPLLYYYQYL